MPERDEWGETSDERFDRIAARDLAWLQYEADHTDAGAPPTGQERVAFNAGYAAAHGPTPERQDLRP